MTTDDILQFAPLFNDEMTLDNLDKIQLVGLCQYLGLNTFGSNYLLRARIRSRLAELKADDLVIINEGID